MAHKPLQRNNPSNVGQLHYYHTDFYYSMPDLNKTQKMHGVKRVLVFCILIVILPATLIIIPLYLRKFVFADVTYPVAESDIIEIRDGISSIFCEQHTLRMNSHFNAFQLRNRPAISPNRKHIKLKKSMTLPDDTLEYWGFYLLKGAKVHLKFCSRYDGSKILVVKGQRELELCGLLEHNKNKIGANYAQGHEQVRVFFEEFSEIHETMPTDELYKQTGIDSDNIMEHENHGGEDLSNDNEEDFKMAYNSNDTNTLNMTESVQTSTTKKPRKKLKKGTLRTPRPNEQTDATNGNSLTETPTPLNAINASTEHNRTRRHKPDDGSSDAEYRRVHMEAHTRRKQEVYEQLYKQRAKRDHIYDRKYSHGGNAVNFTETDESNSISSFENGLFDCFNGRMLLSKGFPRSDECTNAHFLDNGTHRMLVKHDVSQDGYYYYLFYSDNDLVRNDIHAIFDIYKPTFQYSNLSESHGCVNATNCTFSIGFLSNEIVVVEVPTRDGIEHEEDDITYLISTCHPRTEIYALFPISVLILILSCSFL